MKNKYYTYEEVMSLLEPRIREMFHKNKSTDTERFNKDAYHVVTWEDVKTLKDQPGFYDHAILITDPEEVEKYGHSAYYVEKMWLY